MAITVPEIICCPLGAIDGELLTDYRSLLSGDELQRLTTYKKPEAAKEFLVARALLRETFSTRLRCAPVDLVFERDVDGKPQLANQAQANWHFNLSHGRNWVALIISAVGPVGIDVEGHARRNNLSGIAQRFFSAAENNALANCTADQWFDYFFAIWTLKEAHAKARGCGLAKILSCSSITLDWGDRRIDFELQEIARSALPLTGWLYRLDAAVSLAAIATAPTMLMQPAVAQVIPLRSTQPMQVELLASGNWQS
ncbi:MAG: 4-phosphopantetheinyl transferase [Verrucomicrobiaceae bacterium]|nr:4-phosphopantetheinyl transferase [Verrucomicrobiaceae bacterium]